MYRVIKITNKFYAMKIDFEEDAQNISDFISSGDVVILCNELEELEDYGIEEDEIEIVEPDTA